MAKGPAKKLAKKPARPVTKPAAKKAAKAPASKPAPAKPVVAPKPVAKPMKAWPPPPPPRPPVVPPPPPIAVVRPPAAEAVTAFEQGMSALQRHDYRAASTTFQSLVDQFPQEGFLADRARVYLELAARELRKQKAGNGSVEERLTAATLALNNHNDVEAARLAADVLNEDRSQDLAEYLLAVVACRGGDVETSLAHLRSAIALNPECRLQARQDEEFDPLFDSDDFLALIEAPASSNDPAASSVGMLRKPVRRPSR